MGKVFLGSLGGVVLMLSGIFIMYLYVQSLDNKPNIFVLIASQVIIAGGIFCLYKFGKSDAMFIKKPKELPKPETEEEVSVIDKNNSMINDFKKTTETRDRLKLLESAGGG
jgi:hypothetical protein